MKTKLNCVILIDDDENSSSLTRAVIDQSDSTRYMIEKNSVQSAVKYLSHCIHKTANVPPPDLILLDVNTSKKTGWDFLQFFQEANQTFTQKPIICLLSSNITSDKTLRIPDLPHLVGLFEKPLTHKTFSSIVNKYFS